MILKNGKEISEQEFYDDFVEYYSHHYIYSVCRDFAESDLMRLKSVPDEATFMLPYNEYVCVEDK